MHYWQNLQVQLSCINNFMQKWPGLAYYLCMSISMEMTDIGGNG